MSSTSNLPLAIDLTGPMALQINNSSIDVWIPKLDDPHQIGIGTDFDSGLIVPDTGGNYELEGVTHSTSITEVYRNGNGPCGLGTTPADGSYLVHLILPLPLYIKGLSPVKCAVYPKDKKNIPPDLPSMPTGFRLLYPQTGSPVFKGPGGPYSPSFDPIAGEAQLEVRIACAPFDTKDPGHVEARNDCKRTANPGSMVNQLRAANQRLGVRPAISERLR